MGIVGKYKRINTIGHNADGYRHCLLYKCCSFKWSNQLQQFDTIIQFKNFRQFITAQGWKATSFSFWFYWMRTGHKWQNCSIKRQVSATNTTRKESPADRNNNSLIQRVVLLEYIISIFQIMNLNDVFRIEDFFVWQKILYYLIILHRVKIC